MRIEDIRTLARIMKENGLTNLKIDEKGTVIELSREVNIAQQTVKTAPAIINAGVALSADTSDTDNTAIDDASLFTVTAPMVGMFYAAPGPKDTPYAAIGKKVKAGDTLCIIEAMKLMNEIASEVDGVIEEICVVNEQVVEFGQPLFRIRRD